MHDFNLAIYLLNFTFKRKMFISLELGEISHFFSDFIELLHIFNRFLLYVIFYFFEMEFFTI